MACSSITLAGINTGCKDNMGGIKEVYIIKKDYIESITLSQNQISAFTISVVDPTASEPVDQPWSTYKFRKGTSQFTSTMNTDDAAGTMSFETVLALQFSKQDTAKRLEIMALCMDEVAVIVLDNNGKYWFLGYDNPVTASAATGQTGTAFADFGGYNVELTDTSKELPYEVKADAISSLVINPAPSA
jgi:hypothetical protein